MYAINQSDIFYKTMLDTTGASVREAIDMPHKFYTHTMYLLISKFFLATKTTLRLRLSASLFNGQSLINDDLFDSKTVNYQFSPGVSATIFSWLNADYDLQSDLIHTFAGNDQKSAITFLRHHLNFFVFPHKNQMARIEAEYYNQDGDGHYFIDLLYRYTFSGTKTDLELKWNNIFNQGNYISYSSGGAYVYKSIIRLRPGQVLLSVRFRF